MQKSVLLITILLLLIINISSQTLPDTTIWYPLQIGNVWQYTGYYQFSSTPLETYSYVREVVDTVRQDNGKSYFKIKEWSLNSEYDDTTYSFERVINNELVFRYDSYVVDSEYILFDFTARDDSVWEFTNLDSTKSYIKLFGTSIEYFNMLQSSLTTKLFSIPYWESSFDYYVDLPDYRICKGFGMVSNWVGLEYLGGAIINGKIFGYITDTEKNDTYNIVEIFNVSAYPNPFNPTTNIRITIPEIENVIIKVYSSLGEEIKTIYKGELNPGPHLFPFSGQGLTSGVYFCTVSGKDFLKTIKLLLVK